LSFPKKQQERTPTPEIIYIIKQLKERPAIPCSHGLFADFQAGRELMHWSKKNNSGRETIKSANSAFFSVILQKMNKNSQKYFWLFVFGHFLCPFFKSSKGLLNFFSFVTIMNFYGKVTKKIILVLLR